MNLTKLLPDWFCYSPIIQPYLPENTRVYCIGDIHGCDHLLLLLWEKIEADIGNFKGKILLIYLGDFIDRGQNSKQIIDQLLINQRENIKAIYLRGNHEQTLLECLQNPLMIPNWIAFGGLATLNSYGVYLDHIATTIEDFTELQQQFKQKLPRDHYEFFIQTRLSYTIGSYFFVHAGIYPKRNLSDQYPDDLLWIRETFTRSKRNYGKIIVHGHTISDKPELLPNRIGIDTGAYMSGILTCLVLEDCYQRILQTQ